jgi:Trp operon repressor
VKAELQRIAEQEGVSVSSAGAAFLEKALQHNLHSQHTALLDLTISKAIGKHMRSYSTRLAVLLVRSIFASEQARSLVTNILSRQPGVTQPLLEHLLNSSSNTAKRNITRVTPQLKTMLTEVEQWIREEVTLND